MKEGGFNVGCEQSGHMILSDHATTGDGTLAALQVLAELVAAAKPASELLHQFDPVPQLLRSEEHTSELQSLMRISYAVFCLKKKRNNNYIQKHTKIVHIN